MGSSDGLGRSHPVRPTPQMDQGIAGQAYNSSSIGSVLAFSESLAGPTLRKHSVHFLPALRALPLFACLGLSMKIIDHDLSRPNEVLVIQDTNVREHVRNRDLGNVRPRPVAKDGVETFAFEELVNQPDFCGVPISKNFMHLKRERHCPHSLATTFSASA